MPKGELVPTTVAAKAKKPIAAKPAGSATPTTRFGGGEAAQGYRTVTTDPRAAAAAGEYLAGVNDRRDKAYAAGQTPSWSVPAPGSSSYGTGGGGGSGGGGGGSVNGLDPALVDQYLAQLQGGYDTNLASSRQGAADYGSSIDAAYQKDAATSNDAYAQLDQYLAGLDNPYAHIGPASAAQVDPTALSNLIQSQGGGDAGLLAQAKFLQAQNGASASASDRLAQLLAAAQASWNQGTQTAGKQAGAQTQSALAAQLAGLQAGAAGDQRSREDALRQALQQAQLQVAARKAGM